MVKQGPAQLFNESLDGHRISKRARGFRVNGMYGTITDNRGQSKLQVMAKLKAPERL
jgi:hypothetical protein